MNEDQIINTMGGGYGLNWGQIIMRQVDRLMAATTKNLMDPIMEDSFRNGIRGLEAILIPYQDEEYIKDKNEIKSRGGNQGVIDTIDEFYEWLGCLCRLAGRSGLMPFEEGTMYDDRTV